MTPLIPRSHESVPVRRAEAAPVRGPDRAYVATPKRRGSYRPAAAERELVRAAHVAAGRLGRRRPQTTYEVVAEAGVGGSCSVGTAVQDRPSRAASVDHSGWCACAPLVDDDLLAIDARFVRPLSDHAASACALGEEDSCKREGERRQLHRLNLSGSRALARLGAACRLGMWLLAPTMDTLRDGGAYGRPLDDHSAAPFGVEAVIENAAFPLVGWRVLALAARAIGATGYRRAGSEERYCGDEGAHGHGLTTGSCTAEWAL
jgi:hypothetical protein